MFNFLQILVLNLPLVFGMSGILVPSVGNFEVTATKGKETFTGGRQLQQPHGEQKSQWQCGVFVGLTATVQDSIKAKWKTRRACSSAQAVFF